MNTYSIVLADDHAMLRQGLKRILEERHDLKVTGETGDGLELLDLVNELKPHLVVLDISMPNIRGIEAIHEIRRIHPGIKILMLTMHNDEEYLYQALSAGADGYLLKEDADRELFSAVDKVRRGEIFI
ncbi:MAG: DNA-binding response regulator, partial [Nitrospiraceae bacterium]